VGVGSTSLFHETTQKLNCVDRNMEGRENEVKKNYHIVRGKAKRHRFFQKQWQKRMDQLPTSGSGGRPAVSERKKQKKKKKELSVPRKREGLLNEGKGCTKKGCGKKKKGRVTQSHGPCLYENEKGGPRLCLIPMGGEKRARRMWGQL